MTLTEKEWFIEAPWGRLCVVAWGNSINPPVLVCHGSWDSIASFRRLIKRLPQNFYYIGFELPGCGKSDAMPPGLMITVFDLVYSLQVVVKHFRWKEFAFMGHSLGSSLGLLYNMAYPKKITKMVLLDPVTLAFSVPPEEFPTWYKLFFSDFFKNYKRYSSLDEKPVYTKEVALNKLIERRGLDLDTAMAIIERSTEDLGDGYVRFSFDPRMKMVASPPIPDKVIEKMFTSVKTSILAIIAGSSKNQSLYSMTPYLFDENAFVHKNFKFRIVEGGHDVHAVNPDEVAPFVSQFLLYGVAGLEASSKL
ncbi:putative serine hydrolase protein [Danaus plexippus plexippus]|uniref:Serine hydrolase protein n=1 Tax=Danaus plexippus plexippus TaxID=278856 RepID=A0A212FBV4_DANPL|nr:serine hydrolase-like protein 2 isoform X2 [Danaus plexippus plexippus]OWR51197.1 putative serine hydrolase protein [Danaus plexippus plexippus]